jgi:hypothetical protein
MCHATSLLPDEPDALASAMTDFIDSHHRMQHWDIELIPLWQAAGEPRGSTRDAGGQFNDAPEGTGGRSRRLGQPKPDGFARFVGMHRAPPLASKLFDEL